MRVALALVICTVLLFGSCGRDCPRCPEPPPERTKVALIFCDVTNSLTKGENRRVGSIAADIVSSLPPGSIYKLYPIQIQTQIPAPIEVDANEDGRLDDEDYRIPPEPANNVEEGRTAETRKRWRERARELILKSVDGLYDQMNKGPDNRTCIVNALSFASNYLSTNYGDTQKYEPLLFIISDMVEECNSTPLPGQLLKMNKPDISEEIQKAKALSAEQPAPDGRRFGCRLADVTAYCVFPASPETPTVPRARRPDRDQVKEFWNAVFGVCGLKGEGAEAERIVWVDSGDLTQQLRSLGTPYVAAP